MTNGFNGFLTIGGWSPTRKERLNEIWEMVCDAEGHCNSWTFKAYFNQSREPAMVAMWVPDSVVPSICDFTDRTCPNDCTNPSQGTCDSTTGICDCKNGFGGIDCDSKYIQWVLGELLNPQISKVNQTSNVISCTDRL